MSPPVFGHGQLYAIRAPLDSTYVTCVYALLAGKSQSEYEEMLRAVIHACHQFGFTPDVSVVMTDFEIAVMRATTDVLGSHVQHVGCFYHLTQSTWRKVDFVINLFPCFELVSFLSTVNKNRYCFVIHESN